MTSRMTATDELRRLLDERGIEYEPIDSVHSPNRRTLWGKVERGKGILGMDAKYETIEFKKGMRLTISDCSPEQAVEATLGRGTCRVVRKPVSYSDDWKESFEAAGVVEVYTPTCSECGAYIEPPSEFTAGWNYCPNCGRRIEVDA